MAARVEGTHSILSRGTCIAPDPRDGRFNSVVWLLNGEYDKSDGMKGEDVFKAAPPGDEENLDWIIAAHVDSTASPEKQIEQVLAIAPILPGQHHATFEADKALPSQQGKELLPQDKPNPTGLNDLIDFGQNDGASATPSQPTKSAQPSNAPPGLQAPLIPDSGNNLSRSDSLGNEEKFFDAES